MLRNKKNKRHHAPVIKLFSLSAAFLLQAACGGGESNSEASALGIEDVSIAYVKRPTPRDDNGVIIDHDIREPLTFSAGGDLYLQARATSTANVKNITRRITQGLGDVKDVNVSYNGKKIVFSLRLEDPNPNDQDIPNWYLYEYDIPSDTITQLTSAGSDDGNDISPHYLPEDDRIIFASTRQTASKRLSVGEGKAAFNAVDENRRNSSFSLHVRNADGSIQQVSFNPSNDLDPIVLKDSGRILFSRWNNMGSRNDISLYTMNPDGSDVQMYYGAHSHRTGQDPNSDVHFYKPREMENGQIVSILRPFVTSFGGGDIVFINAKDFADNTQPIWSQQGFISGTAQTTYKQSTLNGNGLSLNGRYNAIYPLPDGSNRFLMSWSQCQIHEVATDPNSRIIPCTLATQAQLNDPNAIEAPPSYGIFLVDTNTQVPLIKPEVDMLLSDIVMAYETKKPPVIFDKNPGTSSEINQEFASQRVGVLHIRSVYDFDASFGAYGTTLPTSNNDTPTPTPIVINTPAKMANPKNIDPDKRPARFIRIIKHVSLPDRTVVPLDNDAFGRSTQQGMREIIGYAPIEPDGSVKIKVPANAALSLSILDKDGRRISNRHQSWFKVRPGATLECVGCHTHNTNNLDDNKPHGRPDYASTFNQGAPTTGQGFPFSSALLEAEMGETMAETRARQSCISAACADMKPSTDLMYSDVWTDEVASNRSAAPSFTIDYSELPLDPNEPTNPGAGILISSPANPACSDNLGNPNSYNDTLDSFAYCRIVINYEQHIEPIWTSTINRPNGSCVSCHNKADNDAALLIPTNNPSSYQLELVSNTVSDDPFYNSFAELTSDVTKYISDGMGGYTVEQRQVEVGGVPQFNLDPITGLPDPLSPIMEDVTRAAPVQTSGALTSYFMEKMTNTELNETDRSLSDFTQTVDHSGYLTPTELKLITEWLDLGSQYFNNPFDSDVPTN